MKTWVVNGNWKPSVVRAFMAFVVVSSGWKATWVHSAGPLAIQDAKIYTVSGEPIESGTVLIRDGRIVDVGSDVRIPGEARVIDAQGMVVMPGFIDAHNSAGMSQANEQNSVVPFLSVVDSIDPVASYFEECRRNGITSAAVVPGNSTLIGGKAVIVKTAGRFVDDMIVRRDSGIKLSLRPTSGSRMSQLARLRRELDKAKAALEKEAERSEKADEKKAKNESAGSAESERDEQADGEKSKGDTKEEGEDKEADKSDEKGDGGQEKKEEGLEALKLAVQGKLPAYIYCEKPMDVVAAVKLSEGYGLTSIFVLGRDCYKAADLLAKQKTTVILDPSLVFWETDPRTREDKKIVLPRIYQAAGVPFVFQIQSSGSQSTLGSSYFWYQAATAVKYGVSTQDALAAVTLEPAKLLGIEKLVGSIEVGKDADLIVLTGEPLEIGTWVEHTIVGGNVVYNRADDEKLERLLSPEAE